MDRTFSPPSLTAKHSSPQEFLQEIDHYPPNSEPIVRVNVRQPPDRLDNGRRHTWVSASYLRHVSGSPIIVSLDYHVGVTSIEVDNAANELAASLRFAISERGFTTLGGYYSHNR